MEKLAFLRQKIIDVTSYIPHSRTHVLKTFTMPETKCRVKRDDELGCCINGTKWRKYTSLMPYLLNNHCQQAVVIGGAYSNHVLGISQLLIENRIKPILFLLGNPNVKRQGNSLLISLLVPESQIEWISREEWPQVETLAADYIKKSDVPTSLIPEGGCMNEALPGALTLPVDILQNQEEELQYQHIFMDAGTGLSAIATILAFAWLKRETLFHILLLADDEELFLGKLKLFQQTFEQFVEETLEWNEIFKRVRVYRPKLARSFGSVNQTILSHIQFLAQEEGFFTDPIYSAKLFWEAKEIIHSQALTGNILVIHSGGALTLMGFQEQLSLSKRL